MGVCLYYVDIILSKDIFLCSLIKVFLVIEDVKENQEIFPPDIFPNRKYIKAAQ